MHDHGGSSLTDCNGRRSVQTGRVVRWFADEIAVASITWFELAWLAENNRIAVAMPIRSWLESLAADVRTVGTTPAIAATALALRSSFPGDPADRLIYATAVEQGWQLVTKDERLRRHRHPRRITVW
jgi:PIN domain nuclease of toxin-antitoxin system